jgi:Ala-tRNA(Pro) deacylase
MPENPTPAPAAHEIALPSPDAREEALYARFAALGILWNTHAHAPVFTVEEARNLRGSLPGTHTKNLFLEDKRGVLWLVIAREDLRVDLNALAKALHAPRFSFGAPERLVEVLRVPPGSVTPFALMYDVAGLVTAVFDRAMLAGDSVNFHPLRNDRTTAISPADLVRFAESCGHPPLILNLPEKA